MHVKCKKILACGGGDIFHVKLLLGEGVRKIYLFILTKRETSFEKKKNIYIYIIAKTLIFRRRI